MPRPRPAPEPALTEPVFTACTGLPKTFKLDMTPLPPIVTLSACGQDRPLKLTSLTQNPSVTIKPPATTNCSVTAALGRWLNTIVQPLARKLLNAPIVQLINVSSYVCRNRNSRPEARISEHAFANALDIAAFVTETGEIISVKKHWDEDSKQARFLYAIHSRACGIFGTVLGPKANAAHHDHFHLDMAARRHNSYCE